MRFLAHLFLRFHMIRGVFISSKSTRSDLVCVKESRDTGMSFVFRPSTLYICVWSKKGGKKKKKWKEPFHFQLPFHKHAKRYQKRDEREWRLPLRQASNTILQRIFDRLRWEALQVSPKSFPPCFHCSNRDSPQALCAHSIHSKMKKWEEEKDVLWSNHFCRQVRGAKRRC